MSPSFMFCARWLGPSFTTEAVDEFHGAFLDAAAGMRARTTIPGTAEEVIAHLLTAALFRVLDHDQHVSMFWRDLAALLYDRATQGDPA